MKSALTSNISTLKFKSHRNMKLECNYRNPREKGCSSNDSNKLQITNNKYNYHTIAMVLIIL
jgi:hypothetical protein